MLQEAVGVTHVSPLSCGGGHDRLGGSSLSALLGLAFGQDPLVVAWHDLDEALDGGLPVVEQALGDGGAGLVEVPLDAVAQERAVVVVERVEVDHLAC